MRGVSGLAVVAGLAWGQTAPNTATEIANIRDRVRTYLEELPRVTCIERTRQTIRVPLAELTETREDSCDTHQYKLFAVQSLDGLGDRVHKQRRTAAVDWRDRLKEASLDASTGFLAALVDPQADARFRWVRIAKLHGRAVSVYAFYAAMPEGYLLADSHGSVRVPFKGLLYADAGTNALVRVEIQCVHIPRKSDYEGVDVVVDFGSFNVNGRRVELPSHSLVRFQMKSGDAANAADYRGYRLADFGVDSRIRFVDGSAGETKEGKR
jgi:hypothetical protein